MKKINVPQHTKAVLAFFFLQILTVLSFGQTTYTSSNIDLLVSGTSTLHDWEMKSVKAKCTAIFAFNNAGQISEVSSISFSTPANGLKSDHNSMDNNAYKALKTDKNPVIMYTMTAISVTTVDAATVSAKCSGKLTIAGKTQDAEVVALCKVNPDKSISVSGARKISMKEFDMQPPTFMLGTIKTGNDITLKFDLILKK